MDLLVDWYYPKKKSIYRNMPKLADERLDTGRRFGAAEGMYPLVCRLLVMVHRYRALTKNQSPGSAVVGGAFET